MDTKSARRRAAREAYDRTLVNAKGACNEISYNAWELYLEVVYKSYGNLLDAALAPGGERAYEALVDAVTNRCATSNWPMPSGDRWERHLRRWAFEEVRPIMASLEDTKAPDHLASTCILPDIVWDCMGDWHCRSE
jgi:hypothetical protein